MSVAGGSSKVSVLKGRMLLYLHASVVGSRGGSATENSRFDPQNKRPITLHAPIQRLEKSEFNIFLKLCDGNWSSTLQKEVSNRLSYVRAMNLENIGWPCGLRLLIAIETVEVVSLYSYISLMGLGLSKHTISPRGYKKFRSEGGMGI